MSTTANWGLEGGDSVGWSPRQWQRATPERRREMRSNDKGPTEYDILYTLAHRESGCLPVNQEGALLTKRQPLSRMIRKGYVKTQRTMGGWGFRYPKNWTYVQITDAGRERLARMKPQRY